MPGHAASWCKGYPAVCPAPSCTQPLNPAAPETFELIEALLGECTGAGCSRFLAHKNMSLSVQTWRATRRASSAVQGGSRWVGSSLIR